jgi:RNA 2',3'-cyclic 3'-phosphodiesterase
MSVPARQERLRITGAGGRSGLERLFVAVPLPESLVAVIQTAQGLLPRTPGLRLMSKEQVHLTLAFIGEVGRDKREAAEAVVRGVSPDSGGAVRSAGFLLLPSARRPRVVALALDDRRGVLTRLFEQVMGNLEAAHVMRREERPFRAHLTIARLREPTGIQPKSECPEFEYRVESVCLFRSELSREGATYEVLARTELDADVDPQA